MTPLSQGPRPASQPTTLIRRRAGRGVWLRRLLQSLLVLAVLWLASRLLQEIGWSALHDRARSAERMMLLAAVVALVARFVLMYLRWFQVLRLLELPMSHRYGFTTLLAAVLVNHLTPTARLLGGVVRARYLAHRYASSFSQVFGSVLVDQISHQIVHGSLTWLAVAALAWLLGQRALAMALLAGLGGGVAALLVWSRRRDGSSRGALAELVRGKAERLAQRLGPLVAGGRRITELLRRSFADRRLQARLAILGVAILAVNALAQWLVFRSLRCDVDLLEVLITVAVGTAAGILTGTPGGLATTEAAMIATFVALGVEHTDATAGTLLYRGLHYLIVLSAGPPALIYCELSRPHAATRSDSSAAADSPGSASPGGESPPDSGA